jgi:plasmid maintenance system antidote protein VapI
MEILSEFKKEIERGFTKSELERILDLPKNSLSSILAERVKLSKKALIRVTGYFEKPINERPKPSPKIVRGRKNGSGNKIKQVDIKGFEMKTITIPKYEVKPQSEWGNEMNAVCFPAVKLNSPFDFGDDVFLNIENYTKFPKKERPTTKGEQIDWDAMKKIFDDGIRKAWQIHLQNKKNGK